ncbi:MAG: DUF512 domain-containing protein [Oscillospiraceae bacterium]|nr:DUF512 domain-containing protein [Oscillospiraceae bacterium]
MVNITGVEPHSKAEKAGIKAGDKLLKVGNFEINDLLDYRFYTTEGDITLTLEDAEGGIRQVRIRKGQYDDPGLLFQSFLMDKQHSCRNKCVFCFIDQLPKGLRQSLYFKDDDERLSFLFGNFVTMTNLKDEDIDRIIKMRISPINVSVHTTNPELRVKMMKNPRAAETLSYLKKLTDAGITVNTQIVLCPGWNDGEELRRTLTDLCALGENLQGIAVVPIGLTDHRQGLEEMRVFTPEEAAEAIDLIEEFGDKMYRQRGERVAHPADEFFLLAGREIPAPEYYDGFTQLEDGVGLIASLEEEFGFALEDTEGHPVDRHVSIATGLAAADFLRGLCDRAEKQFPGLKVTVWPVENRLFGKHITVAGLVCGNDIIHTLSGKDIGREVLIPESMLRREGDMLLDDVTPAQIAEKLGVPVTPVPFGGQPLLDALLGE